MSIKQIARSTRLSDDTVTSNIIIMVLQVPKREVSWTRRKIGLGGGGERTITFYLSIILFEDIPLCYIIKYTIYIYIYSYSHTQLSVMSLIKNTRLATGFYQT